MKPREERLVSPTGGAKGAKDIRLGGADALALLELGRVYGMGERKYDRFNYLKGYPWSLSIDAMLRHLLAFMAGEEYDECSTHPGQHDDDHVYDPEVCDGSGLLHTSHVAWHGLTLTSFIMRGIGQDDRFVAPADEGDSPALVVPDFIDEPQGNRTEVFNRGVWGMEVRYGGVLMCCGAREHTLECPQYRA